MGTPTVAFRAASMLASPCSGEAFLRVLDEFGCAKRDATVGADVLDSPSYTNYLCTTKKFFAPARVERTSTPTKYTSIRASKFAGGASPSRFISNRVSVFAGQASVETRYGANIS